MMIQAIAENILAADPDPAVAVRLLRDVLRRPPDDADLRAAQARLESSRWVTLLAAEQHPDGGWGRFHTRDTRLDQQTGTTEQGVWRALALGLDPAHPVLARAADYCAGLLRGDLPFPDPAERNNRWTTGWRLFTASVLAQIRPNDPALEPVAALWCEIARRAFASGQFSRADEQAAHADLTGAAMAGSYLELQNRYAVALLGATLPADLETRLLDWLWSGSLGYLDARLDRREVPVEAGTRELWFAALEVLRGYAGWGGIRARIAPLLWTAYTEGIGWDFGKRASWGAALPLSEDWRRRGRRAHDWTARVLTLL